MSEKQKHIKSYSASDIRNYLEGKLSSAEMNAMEKATMDDPLLSDAMEGMELSNRQQNISFESDMEELKKRLRERIKQQEKNRVLPFLLKWRAAAAVLLLAGAGTLSYFFLIRKPDTNRNISLIPEKNKITDTFIPKDLQTPPVKRDTVSQPAPLKTLRNTADTVSVALNDKSIPNRSLSNRETATDEKKKPEHEPEESRQSPVKVAPNPESSAVAAMEPKKFSTPVPVDKNKADSHPAPVAVLQGKASGVVVQERGDNDGPVRASFNKDKLSGNFYLQGTVADSNGIPIPDATVMLKHSKKSVSTDINGMFKLRTELPDSNQDIVINSVGYRPESVVINPSENKERLIRLSPVSGNLSEVVVVGYGTRKKEVTEEEEATSQLQKKPVIQKAEPVAGWPAYHNYIDKNKKINTIDSLLKGIEIVSFIVNKNGELSSFKIEKSISPAHDARVIRLIREGPAWKLLKGKKHRCRLTIDFN